MKKIQTLKSFGLSLAALALVSFLNTGQAFDANSESYTNAFDNSASVASWMDWYGWSATLTWNSTVWCNDPVTAGNAGSMEVDMPSAPTGNQIVMFGTFGNGAQWDKSITINANLYTNVIFDILVSSNCPVNANGNYGQYQVGFVNDASGYIWLGNVSIPAAASNHWVHCVLPISKTLPQDITSVYGIAFKMTAWWSTDPSEPPTTGMTNWVDNLVVEITPGPPPPPPTLLSSTMKKAIGGVNCIAVDSGSANINNRYSIVTTNTAGLGPNSGDTVTYSWNIASFANDPDGFQGHFIISCGADSGTPNVYGGPGPYDSAVDWNWGNVIFVTIQANSGSAYMNFHYKTNQPNGNSQIWASNYCTVSASSAIGTWSVSIEKSTGTVTMTSPENSTNFNMDLPSLGLFTDPLALTLGGQPNTINGEGQSVVYSSFSAAGCATPFSDNFATDTKLNTNIWFVLAADANGVQFVPPNGALWLAWTRPDGGFSPQGATDLLSTFENITPVTTLLYLGNRMILIPSSNVGAGQSFYRLILRTFTKLQILLPGETAAPNTPSGKTGTPLAQSAGVPFNVIVNGVDANWNVVSVTDTIRLTSPGDFFVVNDPTDLPLVGGTATFSVEFLSSGSATITATDFTDGSKTPDTSPTVTY